MAIAYYIISLVIIVILVALKAPWYFVIATAILCAGWSIADAIRDGSDNISASMNDTRLKIMDISQKIKEAIEEFKDK